MFRILIIAFLFVLTPLAYSQGAYLGVQLEAPQGAQLAPRIAGVEQPSAASLMGLEKGDVILAIDEVPIQTVDGLLATLGQRLPGEIVQIKVFRGLEEKSLTGILGRRPDDAKRYQPQFPQVPQPQFREWGTMPDWNAMPDWNDWPQLENWPDLPDWGSPFSERPLFPRGFPQLRIPNWDELHSGLDLPSFQFDISGAEDTEREVHILYPESTPEADREALIQKAKEQYGDEATVEFKGNAHSISIRQSSRSLEQTPIPSPLPNLEEDEEL